MSLTCYLPRDTTTLALGGQGIAAALVEHAARRSLDMELVRSGSRGAFWLEPLLEVVRDGQRMAFGPLTAEEVPGVLDALAADVTSHPLYLGDPQAIPWLAQQQRLTFSRAGLGDPLSIAHYQSHQGFAGLQRALTLSPQEIVTELTESGLRGRGGAAFPAGIKWQTVLDTSAQQKFVVCNADEGDSGTFADRLLMESDPLQLIEGMIIAGLAVGATQGYIYLRSEYPEAFHMLSEAIAAAQQAGYLGRDICGTGRAFALELRLGAGAYICGEETALLDSLEGKRGVVRAKPPLPAVQGLFDQPTLVHNVLTLAAASTVLARGAKCYRDWGMGRSRGTLTVQLAGNIRRGGLVEIPFGPSLREVVENFGGGTASGRPIKAIQVGGPLGAYLPEAQWDTALDYESFADIGAMLGHGGVVVFDDSADMSAQARFAMEFCAAESCGKCTPCRIGAVRGVELVDRIIAREAPQENTALLRELCDTMEHGSLCAMGGLTPNPVRSALDYFVEDFG